MLSEWTGLVDRQATTKELELLQLSHRQLRKELQNLTMDQDVRMMQQYNVVGMTTTECAKRRKWLENVGFEILICEEAAEVLEAHSLCTFLPTLKHSIAIGDPLQLRSEITEHAVALDNPAGGSYRLDESLFEHIMKPIDKAAKTISSTQLSV